ncbi:hypothetical protein [Candidatus Odyssella thessalonicensis]|uniref:hypothetical protein n=1 Tax=Candidatus Odyssella thessalonicensis TaxID=84647 RepID=UPI000225B737|nr:hypothetical protein [Candidatus Odyssella thessalonicensis]
MQTLFKSSIYVRYLLLGIGWTQPVFDTVQAQDTAQDRSQPMSRALIVYRNAASIGPIFARVEEERITQERQSFVKQASFFIKPSMTLYEREKTINAIRELPSEKRDAILQVVREVIRFDSDAFEHVLNIIKNLSQADLIKANHIAASLFTPKISVSTRLRMINVLKDLAITDLDEIKTSLQLLLGPKPRDPYWKRLLDIIDHISLAMLKKFILITGEAVGKYMTALDRMLMASSFAEIPAMEWEDVLHCATKIIPSYMEGIYKVNIITMLGRLSNSERLQALPLIQEWVRPKMAASDQFKIIEAILKLPAAEWGSVLTHAASVIEPTMNAYERLHIIEEMQLLPYNQREEVLPIAKSIITSDMNAYVRAGIISKINAIPPQHREETIPYVRALMAKGQINEGIEDFFDAVSSLASAERQEIINYALPCISEGMQGQHCKRLLEAIKAVPSHERQEVITEALAVREIRKLDSGILIEGIMSIRQQDRKEIIKLAEPFYKKMGYGYQAHILWQAIAEIAAENRAHVLENTRSLIDFPCDYDDFIGIILYLNKLEVTEQKALCEAIIGTYGKVQYATLLQCFSLVPLTAIEDLASRLKAENQEAFSLNYLCKLIRSDADFQTTVFAYWHHLFLQPNEARSKKIAEFILNNVVRLGIYDEHPTVQEAEQIMLLLERSNDPSNPYHFHRQTLKKRQDPVDWSSIQLPVEIVDGYRLTLNPAYLKSLTQETVLFAELPPFNRELLKELDAGIRAKLQANPALASEIAQNYSATYDSLYQGCLGSTLLQNLLNTQGDKEAPVPLTAAKMMAIVNFLGKLPNQASADEILSIQEQTFLQLMASIQHCSTGKEEGIHLYYNNLPSEYKFNGLSTDASDAEKGRQWVNCILQKEIEALLSGTTSYFQALIGMQPHEQVEQASHQARYVKNVIAEEVGLGRFLSFDRHSSCIYQKLINKTKQELIQQFYHHFLPYGLYQAVLSSAQRELPINAKIYTWLAAVLSEPEQQEAWEIDLKSGTTSLTEKGALVLLKKLNILRNPLGSES